MTRAEIALTNPRGTNYCWGKETSSQHYILTHLGVTSFGKGSHRRASDLDDAGGRG